MPEALSLPQVGCRWISIARWDGAAWLRLGIGMVGGISALAFVPDGSLYAGGHFTWAGGMPSYCIARWGKVTPTAVALASFEAFADQKA